MALIDVDLQSLAGLAMIDELDRDLLASDLPGPRMRLMNGVYKAQGREVCNPLLSLAIKQSSNRSMRFAS